MADVVTFLGGFLLGAATAAAGGYFAKKYTDRRREKETQKKAVGTFEKVHKAMPELIDEMKRDLSMPEFHTTREFYVVSKDDRFFPKGPTLRYHPEDHPNLEGKITILENHAYICEVTPGNVPKYRTSEEFVELVLKS